MRQHSRLRPRGGPRRPEPAQQYRESGSLPPCRQGVRRAATLWGAQLRARGLGPGEALTGAPGDEVTLDPGVQREQPGHDPGLDVGLALDADVLLDRHEGDARLGERIKDGDDPARRSAEPGEFALDKATAGAGDPHGGTIVSAAGGHGHGGDMSLRFAGSSYSVGVLQSASERNRVKEPSGLR